MSDLFKIANDYIGPSVIESLFSHPNARWEGDNYVTLSPIKPGAKKVKSFYISEKGLFMDHSTDDKGDLIDLVSQSHGVDKIEACKIIIKAGGGVIPDNDYTPTHKEKTNDTKHKYPIPETDEIKESFKEEVSKEYFKSRYGKIIKVYQYRNFKGQTIFYTARFVKEKEDGTKSKVVVPFYLTVDGKWKNKRPDLKKYPVYGGEKLKDNDRPVLIVEGEKCADCNVEGYNVISFLGGSKAVDKTDWKPLEGKDVVIFPDIDLKRDGEHGHIKRSEDQPGMSAALKIKSYVPQAKIVNIKKIKDRLKVKDGWDIADGIEDKIDIPNLIESAGYVYEKNVKLDPYNLYKEFLNDRYGYGNLDQIDGIFFKYHEKRHYWERIIADNIKPDIKSWLEKTGLVDVIIESEKNLKTMINDIHSYVQSHALDYINDNPFKTSGISPWLHHKDGAINFTQKGFVFHSREDKDEHFFKSMYPVTALNFGIDQEFYENFDPEKDCPAFNYYLTELIPDKLKNTDFAELEKKKTVELFSQILAYSLSPIKKNEYFFGFIGKEGTGKSFFIKILKSLVGEEFTIEQSISDIEKNRFATANFMNSKIFIEPDMDANTMLPDGWIKKHAGEQSITVENKFENAIKGVKISIAMFIVSNNDLKVPNMQGINRRLTILKYDNVLKNVDFHLFDKIVGKVPHGKESGDLAGKTFDERPGLFALALKGWESFVKNDHRFTMPEWVKQEKDTWKRETNTAILFMEDKILEEMEFRVRVVLGKDLYQEYASWCKEESITHPYGKQRFFNEIRLLNNVKETKNSNKISFRILQNSPENLKEINDIKDDIEF